MRPSVSRRLPAAIRTAALAGVIALIVGACSGGATTTPTATPGSSPTAGPDELVLDRAPDNTACDAIGVDYTSLTFHIDLTSSPQIWAEAGTTRLTVRWDSSFEAGTGTTPSVVDASGAVVLEDGDRLDLPADGSYPDLGGHFVCTGPTGLIILDEAPAG